MRLFFALPVPPDIVRVCLGAQADLRAAAPGGQYVPRQNFHVTMHFIGESGDLMGAAAACDLAVRGIRPFLLRPSGVGRFLRAQRYTAYLSLDGELDELHRLHETLTAALTERGFSLSGGGHKRLTPHITLARNVPLAAQDDFPSLRIVQPPAFRVNQLLLYQSESGPGGMVYTPLHRSKLVQ